jgi:ribosome-associated protein
LPNDVAVRLMKLAGSRLTQDGVIVLTAQNERSQKRNREEALARLVELIRQAAVKPVKRRATKPTRASREKRLEGKKRRSGIKGLRQNKPRAE